MIIMDKNIRNAIEDIIKTRKPEKDIQLELAVEQCYVPSKCYLDGRLVMVLTNSGEDPCRGCNLNRKICGGRW